MPKLPARPAQWTADPGSVEPEWAWFWPIARTIIPLLTRPTTGHVQTYGKVRPAATHTGALWEHGPAGGQLKFVESGNDKIIVGTDTYLFSYADRWTVYSAFKADDNTNDQIGIFHASQDNNPQLFCHVNTDAFPAGVDWVWHNGTSFQNVANIPDVVEQGAWYLLTLVNHHRTDHRFRLYELGTGRLVGFVNSTFNTSTDRANNPVETFGATEQTGGDDGGSTFLTGGYLEEAISIQQGAQLARDPWGPFRRDPNAVVSASLHDLATRPVSDIKAAKDVVVHERAHAAPEWDWFWKDLVGCWPLDEGGGTTARDIVTGERSPFDTGIGGTLPTWTPNVGSTHGKMVRCQNDDGAIDINGHTAMTDSFTPSQLTLLSYGRWENIGSDPRIISKALGTSQDDHDWMLGWTQGSELFRMRLRTGATTHQVSSALTIPQHLGKATGHGIFAGVYNGANIRLWLANKWDTAVTAATGTVDDRGSARARLLNGGDDGTNRPNRVGVNYIAIWKRALKASELQQLAADPFGPFRGGGVVLRAPAAPTSSRFSHKIPPAPTLVR